MMAFLLKTVNILPILYQIHVVSIDIKINITSPNQKIYIHTRIYCIFNNFFGYLIYEEGQLLLFLKLLIKVWLNYYI